mgnify:CR=1 FL=1
MLKNYTPIRDQAQKVWTDNNGWLRIDGVELTRETVNKYLGSELDPDGSHGLKSSDVYSVYRSPEALEDTVNEFTNIDVSDKHEMDNPDNHIRSIGSIGAAETSKENNQTVIRGNVVIKSTPYIDAINKKDLNAFSVGYDSVLDFTPGTTPWGEPYDVKITKIIPNHLKLTNNPRVKTATITDEDFVESEHPRDNNGQFTSGTSRFLSKNSNNEPEHKESENHDYTKQRKKDKDASISAASDIIKRMGKNISSTSLKEISKKYGLNKKDFLEIAKSNKELDMEIYRNFPSNKWWKYYEIPLGDDEDFAKFDNSGKNVNIKTTTKIKDSEMKFNLFKAIMKKHGIKDEDIEKVEKDMKDADYASRVRAALQEAGFGDEEIEKAMNAINPILEDVKSEDAMVEKATAKEEKEEVAEGDEEEPKKEPEVAPKKEEELEKKETEDADGELDAKIEAAVAKKFAELKKAQSEVTDCVGKINVGDSASVADIYKAGCKILGVDTKDMKDDDLKVAFKTAAAMKGNKINEKKTTVTDDGLNKSYTRVMSFLKK